MTEVSRAIMLELLATDPELSSELARFRQGRERSDFAITAKKIGVLALRQAQGRIEAEQVRREGDRMIENLRQLIDDN